MKQISILGCGWLGLPLAEALMEKGFLVKGSTTSSEKLSVIENLGIQPFWIVLESNNVSGDIETFLQGSKTLIIDIPPKLRGNPKEDFVGKIATFIPFIEKSEIENVLFVSSTSVYGDTSSFASAQDDTLSVTEETKTCPETESGRQLVAVEQLLQTNTHFKTTILRFGGLIGEDRHPIRFLAGRKNLENPKAPINLIHQTDCIGIIMTILRQAQHDKWEWNETFNAVAPFHPTREAYYTQKGIDLGLDLPEFNDESPTFGKTILSTKVENVLGYTFSKPNL
jgi:nucleoside-diphosphate-sugar epimerase